MSRQYFFTVADVDIMEASFCKGRNILQKPVVNTYCVTSQKIFNLEEHRCENLKSRHPTFLANFQCGQKRQ
jgi:hypothetical protein